MNQESVDVLATKDYNKEAHEAHMHQTTATALSTVEGNNMSMQGRRRQRSEVLMLEDVGNQNMGGSSNILNKYGSLPMT